MQVGKYLITNQIAVHVHIAQLGHKIVKTFVHGQSSTYDYMYVCTYALLYQSEIIEQGKRMAILYTCTMRVSVHTNTHTHTPPFSLSLKNVGQVLGQRPGVLFHTHVRVHTHTQQTYIRSLFVATHEESISQQFTATAYHQ